MATAQTLCAVLIAGSPVDDTSLSPLAEETPLHLTPLLSKTPLIFAVQALIEIGVTRVICLGWAEPQVCQAQLQSGERWGCEIEWHSIAGPEHAFKRLADLAPAHGPFLLANTCHLMRPTSTGIMPAGTMLETETPTSSTKLEELWNWAWLDRHISQQLGDLHQWRNWPIALASVCTKRQSAQALSLMDGTALLTAVPVMLQREFPVVLDASEVEPGIFLSSDVIIHPTAEIHAPFYAGPDVEIEKDCQIGPAVAISKRTRIGQSCHITHSQIGPGSWIGESLDIHNSIVFRGVIWSCKYQARMTIFDAVILTHGPAQWKASTLLTALLERSFALLLWLLLMPIWIALALRSWGLSSPVQHIKLVQPDFSHMAIPTVSYASWLNAETSTRGIKHLLGFVLPNLWGVLTGRWLLLGMRPRTPQEWSLLPASHQRWLATKPSGLIQEEWLMDIEKDDVQQSMVLERYQQLRANSVAYRLGLIGRYLRECVLQTWSVGN